MATPSASCDSTDVRHGAATMAGELSRDLFDVFGVETADLGPALERLLMGGVTDHLQGRLDPDRGRRVRRCCAGCRCCGHKLQIVHEDIAADGLGRILLVGVDRRGHPIHQRDEVVEVVGGIRVG